MHNMREWIQVAGVFLVLLAGMATVGEAAIFYVDCCAPAGGDGSSWGTAFTAIQDAIDAATEPSQVWVAAATCSCDELITLKSGIEIYGGFGGWETSRDQRDYKTNVTIIDAAGAPVPRYHVVTISGVTETRIDGFTLRGGTANGPGGGSRVGAGIYCINSDNTNTIANCLITHNSAYSGGGVYCSYASPDIVNCIVRDNRGSGTAGMRGGGVYLEYSSSLIKGCTITGNWIDAFFQIFGGGVYYELGCSSATLENCIVSGNRINDLSGSGFNDSVGGGGVYCASSPQIRDCIIAGNSCTTGSGGGLCCGMYIYGGGSPVVRNCIIGGNRAVLGGGISCSNSSFPGIMNCTICSNSGSNSGGGVYCGNSSSPVVKNTLFENNLGLAVREGVATADPVVTNCLFHNNWVSDSTPGDYYDFDTSATLLGAAAINAVTGNSGNVEGDPLFVMDDPFYARTGIWSSTPSYNSTTRQTTLYAPPDTFTTDALVGELINPNTTQRRQAFIVSNSTASVLVLGDATVYSASGDTYRIMDYHLADCASAAIDWGTSSGAPSSDIEGAPRPVDIPGWGMDGTGEGYDIGAYEFQDITCPVEHWRRY